MKTSSKQGNIIVYTGPSGVGKGTILAKVLEKRSGIVLSVSATTRKPRPGEIDGVHYHFMTKEEFKKLVENDEVLEWAEFAGNYYGTLKSEVERITSEGKDIVLEIEVQGAIQVKEKIPDCIMIFISPPSFEELEKRLTGRGTEPPEIIQKRLNIAKSELEHKNLFDYQVINDNLDRAVMEVEAIILSKNVY